MLNLRERIFLDPAILEGRPIIRGTRFPATVIVGSIVGGMTFQGIQREYDITADDIRAALMTSRHRNQAQVPLCTCHLERRGQFDRHTASDRASFTAVSEAPFKS